MIDTNLTILIIALNLDGLNILIKGKRGSLDFFFFKQDLAIC